MNNNDSFRNRQNGFETMDGGAPGKKQKKASASRHPRGCLRHRERWLWSLRTALPQP